MNQSGASSLFFAKTNMKDACFRVPQSSSLPQSCAKEKGTGVEIDCGSNSCSCADVAVPLTLRIRESTSGTFESTFFVFFGTL